MAGSREPGAWPGRQRQEAVDHACRPRSWPGSARPRRARSPFRNSSFDARDALRARRSRRPRSPEAGGRALEHDDLRRPAPTSKACTSRSPATTRSTAPPSTPARARGAGCRRPRAGTARARPSGAKRGCEHVAVERRRERPRRPASDRHERHVARAVPHVLRVAARDVGDPLPVGAEDGVEASLRGRSRPRAGPAPARRDHEDVRVLRAVGVGQRPVADEGDRTGRRATTPGPSRRRGPT